jgi:cell division protease FtsH
MGHALVALSLPGSDPVHKVSIIPRGIGALGYTIQRPTEDRYLMSRRELENKMAVLLGGRAAEKIIFEEVSTGAEDDLAKVTDIARSMITRFGMDESLGQMNYEAEPTPFLGPLSAAMRERRYSEATAHAIDRATRGLIDEAFKKASTILIARRAVLEAGAKALLERETLSQDDLKALMETGSIRRAAAAASE